ncbi:MAG: hypothetical protein JNL32_04715 [Candidatus Kapabacteria bacterium]|nr:hypothetical protein [Candidatus Kapabacteria bacterium]
MHKHLVLIAAICITVAVTGCSDDPVSDNVTQVAVTTALTSPRVTSPDSRRATSSLQEGDAADSLTVTRLRVLVRGVVLAKPGVTDSMAIPTFIKYGPFALIFDSTGNRFTTERYIPEGDYSRITFDIHRLGDKEVNRYVYDPAYNKFVGDERYSVVVEGIAWREGRPFNFTYFSAATPSISTPFSEAITIARNSVANATILFNPNTVFKQGNKILEPRDPRNFADIGKKLDSAFSVIRRTDIVE